MVGSILKLKNKGANVDEQEQIKFFSFIVNLVEVGFSIYDAVKRYSSSQKYKRYYKMLESYVSKGIPFSKGLKRAGICADDIVVSIVEAGENSASLLPALKTVKSYMIEKQKTKKEIYKTFFMPALEVFMCFFVINYALYSLIPKLAGTLKGLNALTGLTEYVYNVSMWYKQNVLFILASYVAVIVIIVKKWSVIKWSILYRVKSIRKIFQSKFEYKIFKQLQLQLQGGVPVVMAFHRIRQSISDKIEKEYILQLTKLLGTGMALSDSIKKVNASKKIYLISDDIIELVDITKYTGEYNKVIEELVNVTYEEYKNALGKFFSILEPLILVFVACIILGLVFIIYYPIFNVTLKGM